MCSRGESEPLDSLVAEAGSLLTSKSLPYWLTSVDSVNGGYILGATTDGPSESGIKTIISQSRLVWVFSYAHARGYSSPSTDYLSAAKNGFQFLQDHLFDSLNGGYYWSTDESGTVTDDRKYVQGQLVAAYALAEYYHASGDSSALQSAEELMLLLLEKAKDTLTGLGGFLEDFTREWDLISTGSGPLGSHGLKSANTIMHMAEAASSLIIQTSNSQIHTLLEDVIDQYSTLFFPEDPADATSQVNFEGVKQGSTANKSYGQMVEWAWIRAESEHALGRTPNWDLFDAYVRYVINNGIDKSTKGLLDGGELVWWPQLEVIRMAITDKRLRQESEYDEVLENVLRFFLCFMMDPEDGVPVWSVSTDGSVLDNKKSHDWKSGFHVTRGLGSLSTVPFSM